MHYSTTDCVNCSYFLCFSSQYYNIITDCVNYSFFSVPVAVTITTLSLIVWTTAVFSDYSGHHYDITDFVNLCELQLFSQTIVVTIMTFDFVNLCELQLFSQTIVVTIMTLLILWICVNYSYFLRL